MSIKKYSLGKESSGAKGSLQPHSLTLPMICLRGPSVTASSDGFVQLGPLILRDSYQQQGSSKTREPDFPDGHQEGRLCTCGRQSLTAPFETRMLQGLSSVSVGRPHRADIYASPLVWNDLPVALPEQQRHVHLQLGVILKFMLESNCANSA